MKNNWLWSFPAILFGIICFYLPVKAQDMNKLDLGGEWQFRQTGTAEWKTATVPGCVHLDLLKNGMIPDPFFGTNESDLQWIGRRGWEYRKTFFIADTFFVHRHIELVCQGLDTWADVYLNDSLVITANNMFRDWYANIKVLLRPGRNILRVVFPPAEEKMAQEYDSLGIKLPGDEKVVMRKAAYHFGWDWGPRFITSGIWKPIYIRYWTHMNVLGVKYMQYAITDSAARMTAEFTLFADVADTGFFHISIPSGLLALKYAVVRKGVNVVRIDFSIPDPKRWWCNGLGDPYLYPVTHRILFNGKQVAEGTTRIGLRTIELVQEKEGSASSFRFLLNGVPVFMKGANYIPQDNFLPRVTDSSYAALIRSAKEANMNMLRVWGGGIYEKDIFYDLCDENGILVWQDFMYACAMYPPAKDFLKDAQAEAIHQIVRLRNHPCLALWCGNNEISEGWFNWGWVKQYGYTPEDSMIVMNGYKILFQGILPQAVARFDSGKAYIETSPKYGWGNPLSQSQGDMHYWGVWWGKAPFSMYNRVIGRFMSEYGFQGFPDQKTIESFAPSSARDPGSEVMKAHQKHPVGFETIEEYLLRDYKRPAASEDYAYVSQLLQARGVITAIEAHRRAKPRCMGTLYWQLNDCWPVVSWSSRDYYGRKKALHFRVRNAYETYLVSPVYEENRLQVHVVSDDTRPVEGELHLELKDFEGRTAWQRTLRFRIQENSSGIVFDTVMPVAEPGRTLLSLSLVSGDKVLARNILYFVPPKDLNLEKPEVRTEIKNSDEGYSVTLSSDKLAKDLFLSTSFEGEFSENYFDLLPGETKTVKFITASRAGGFQRSLKVKSLADIY